MLDILAPLKDNQHIAREAFKMHCESLAMGVPVHYTHQGVAKEVTEFEELSNDFPQLSEIVKQEIIMQYSWETTV